MNTVNEKQDNNKDETEDNNTEDSTIVDNIEWSYILPLSYL